MGNLSSPCNNVCRIAPETGLCEGCKRTVEEIMVWPLATEDEKLAILARLPGRTAPLRRGQP